MADDFEPHVHAYFKLRWPRLVGLLAWLHLPYGWLVETGELPHDPECTERWGVLRSE